MSWQVVKLVKEKNKYLIIGAIILVLIIYKYGDFSMQSVFPINPPSLEEQLEQERAAEEYEATHVGKPNFLYTNREGEGCVSDKDCIDSPPLNYKTNTEIWCRSDGFCEWR